MDSIYNIYQDSNSARLKFKIKNDKEVNYSGFTWLNNKDILLGVESIPGSKRSDYKSNAATFDLSGNLIERIYETKKGEAVGSLTPSRTDKLLLFTLATMGDYEKNPLEGLMRMNDIMVMDLEQKKILRSIKNVGVIPDFEIQESPWIYDENRFVYSITAGTNIILEGKKVNPDQEKINGVYIYNVNTGKEDLLIPGGSFAIASPTSNQIAYIKEKAVRVFDLSNNSTKVVYKIGSKERIRDMHWTPDGKQIYLAQFNYYVFDIFTSAEKLIDIDSGKEIPFKAINHGFNYYSWK